jgi:hypothetical protein
MCFGYRSALQYANPSAVIAAWNRRAALPVQAGEGEKNMPPLSQSLLNLIGEYGHARSDRESEAEIIYRWQTLIGGIKEYAANVLASHLKAGGQGGEDGARAALKPFADAFCLVKDTATDSDRDIQAFLDANTVTPKVMMGDFRRAHEIYARSTPAKANDGEGKR